jgi:integrase
MRDSGLALDANRDNRTLYSWRHTTATLELLRGEVDIHTLSNQLANSAVMIQHHYLKWTATMAAQRLT